MSEVKERATFSFELYPPRSAKAEEALLESLDHLVAAGPEFISVTYGAGGNTRGASLAVLLVWAVGALERRTLRAMGAP